MPFSLRALRHTVALLTFSGLLFVLAGLGASLDGLPASTGPQLRFRVPSSAAVDQRSRLFVADAAGRRLVSADRDGTLRWQRHASPESEGFSRLTSLALDPAGRLYALDAGRNRVVRLKNDGTLDRILFAPQAGSLEAFEVFGSGGWALVRDGPLARTYQVALDGTSRTPVRELAGGPELIRIVPAPWGEAAGTDAAGRLWRSEPSGGWTPAPLPGITRITSLRYLPDGSLLLLDSEARSWWVLPALGGPPRLLRGPPHSRGDWGPVPAAGSDGSLIFCDPEGGAVQVDLGPWSSDRRTGAGLSLWERLRPWLGWLLTAVGLVLLAAAFASAARRLLRRSFDVQILALAALVPAAFVLTMALQHSLFEAFQADQDSRRAQALTEAARTAVAELAVAADLGTGLERVQGWGDLSGIFQTVRVLDLRGAGPRIVEARPDRWTAGRIPPGLPPEAGDPASQGLAVIYEDPDCLRESVFLPLPGGLTVEVGRDREPSAVADLPVYRRLHETAGGITLAFLAGVVGLGAVLLGASAPRHRLARTLTARSSGPTDALRAFFPRTAWEWASGRGSGHGTVVGLSWGRPVQAREAFLADLARRLRELGLFVRAEGALMTAVQPEGLLLLVPGDRDEGLTLAREVLRRWRPFRLAVDAGPWSWETLRLADRLDLRPAGDAVDRVRRLLRWEPLLPLGLAAAGGFLAEFPEVPWRPAGLDSGEIVGQVLDPSDPDHSRLLDYLTPFRAAFDAWTAGRSDELRERLEFLAGRLPDDPVLRRLIGEVFP